jgi:hypothetical protein
MEPHPDGGFTVSIHGEISADLEERLFATVSDQKRKTAIQTPFTAIGLSTATTRLPRNAA